MSHGVWALPLTAGLGYSLGVLLIQRSLVEGVPASLVNFVCNTIMALFFQALWFFDAQSCHGAEFLWPISCGFLFFLGQIMTFRAIQSGDASVSTPLLGTKVLFVALISVIAAGVSFPVPWWWACLMASTGIALISIGGSTAHGHHLRAAVAWSLGAALLYALVDVLVQIGVPRVGYVRFAPVMFGVLGVLSLGFLPSIFVPKESPKIARTPGVTNATGWLFLGAVILSIQSLAMYSAIGLYGNATLTNILYGSRCLWSVGIAWVVSQWLTGGGWVRHSSGVMTRRLAGAVLLIGAMALVLRFPLR